jgi:putative component of toxin-antitoxin plasmid stabilization module
MEQRAAIKFRVKLKKTDTKTFEMLKSGHSQECLSSKSVLEWHKRLKEAKSMRMQKSRVEKILTAFLDAKGIIRQEFVSEIRIINGKFYKNVIKKLIARVHRVRPQFQESGSRYLLHDSAPVHSSAVFSEIFGETKDPFVIPSTLLP